MLHYRELGDVGAPQREWLRRPFREKARIVCSGCNSGWMSSLEMVARPLLEGPILRSSATFGTPQSTVLARWAFKTALVFQASQTDVPMAPPSHFVHVQRSSTPPRQVAVWIGSHYRAKQDAAASVFVQRPLSLKSLDDRLDPAQLIERPFGFLDFLAIGGVSFLIIGHSYDNRVEFDVDGPLSDALIPIWPHRMPIVAWPPNYMMDQELLPLLTLPESAVTARVWPVAMPTEPPKRTP
ncbi:MAG: hypothetical protein ACYCU0_08350 [Solirubrobacteraceae bacterium]